MSDNNFRVPDFSNADLELRFENDIVCIYGTSKGLHKLSELCLDLVESPSQGYIHLEDEFDLLTKESKNGAIAIFVN